MSKLTIQVRTRDDLKELLARGESPAWVIFGRREPLITNVRVVNWEGTEMIEGLYDRTSSRRRRDGRLILGFSDARIVDCDVKFDGRNPVRYIKN